MRAEMEQRENIWVQEQIEREKEAGRYTDLLHMDAETQAHYDFYLHVMSHYRLSRSYQQEWLNFAAEEERKYLSDEQDLDYTVQRIMDRAKMVMEG